MRPLSVGAIQIEKCVVTAAIPLPIEMVLPTSDLSWLREQRDWLQPDHADLASQTLTLSFHSYVVRTAGRVILVDACIGNDKERDGVEFFHRRQSPYLANLNSLGLRPEDVDCVMCTHLHADHVGWNTRLHNGRWVPTFPNAKYLFAQREFEHWQRANLDAPGINQGSFDDSVLPVMVSGQGQLVRSGHEVVEGLVVEPAPGHTPGNVVLRAESQGHRALFSGDVMHHPVQVLRPEWSSGFCSDPLQSALTRRQVLESVADTDTVVLTAHFAGPTAGRVASGSASENFSWSFLEGAESCF